MRQLTIDAKLIVPDSVAALLKEKGLNISFKDGKYVANVGGVTVPIKDSCIEIETARVGAHQRSKIRGRRN